VQYSNQRTEIHEETKTEPLSGVQGASGPGMAQIAAHHEVHATQVEGAKDAGMIGATGMLINGPTNTTITPGTAEMRAEGIPPILRVGAASLTETSDGLEAGASATTTATVAGGYNVRITGPGMDSRIGIKDEEGIDIVEVMLKKVRRLIRAQTEEDKGVTIGIKEPGMIGLMAPQEVGWNGHPGGLTNNYPICGCLQRRIFEPARPPSDRRWIYPL
jgi:hypothetical protein